MFDEIRELSDTPDTFKAKGSKDIVKIVHVTSIVKP